MTITRNFIPAAIVSALLLAGCGNSSDPDTKNNDTVSEIEAATPPEQTRATPDTFGGKAALSELTATGGGAPLADSKYLVERTADYVEIRSEGIYPNVGMAAPVNIEAGTVYEVTATFERSMAAENTMPVIIAWSLDEDGEPLEQNWSARFFTNEQAPVGETVTLKAKFALEASDGVRAFALPDQVRQARFTLTPDRGAEQNQTTRIYAIDVQQVAAE